MKKKISIQKIVLFTVRALFFVLYPALFSTAFTGVRMLVEEISRREPFQWDLFVQTLAVLCVVTIVFGRVFCGFFCAFGIWGDMIYFISSQIQKMRKKKPLRCFHKVEHILRYGKYVVLMVVLLLAIHGLGSIVAMNSPFSAFSRLHAGKSADSMIGLGLFILCTIGMALEPRFFCKFCCPMGAIFSLLPVLPFSVVQRERSRCIQNCKACRMACPASLDLPYTEEGDCHTSGECFACGKCIGKCPRKNLGNRCLYKNAEKD